MSWKTEVQSQVFNVIGNLKNGKESIIDLFNKVTGGAKTQIGSLMRGTSYVGINGNKIPEMRDSIRIYVAEIEANLDKVIENTSTQNAFHGEYAAAITAYVTAVKDLCKAYTTQLLEFSDNLDAIAELYHSKDQEFASNINSSAAETSSQTTAYTEQRADTTYGNNVGSAATGAVNGAMSGLGNSAKGANYTNSQA